MSVKELMRNLEKKNPEAQVYLVIIGEDKESRWLLNAQGFLTLVEQHTGKVEEYVHLTAEI